MVTDIRANTVMNVIGMTTANTRAGTSTTGTMTNNESLRNRYLMSRRVRNGIDRARLDAPLGNVFN
jgi:hypothetical protein